jgi:hypothetical protein
MLPSNGIDHRCAPGTAAEAVVPEIPDATKTDAIDAAMILRELRTGRFLTDTFIDRRR